MITVSLIAAQTTDGFIAREKGETSLSWTSKEDKKRFVSLTKRAKVMVMGRTTWDTIGKALPERLIVVYSHKNPSEPMTGVEWTTMPPKDLLNNLEGRGFTEVAICGGGEIYNLFLREGLVDQIYLTVEPVKFGQGIRFFKDPVAIRDGYQLLHEERVGIGTIFQDLIRKET
jgi:dihydrofolate reductase